jgi:hypothetical protein
MLFNFTFCWKKSSRSRYCREEIKLLLLMHLFWLGPSYEMSIYEHNSKYNFFVWNKAQKTCPRNRFILFDYKNCKLFSDLHSFRVCLKLFIQFILIFVHIITKTKKKSSNYKSLCERWEKNIDIFVFANIKQTKS